MARRHRAALLLGSLYQSLLTIRIVESTRTPFTYGELDVDGTGRGSLTNAAMAQDAATDRSAKHGTTEVAPLKVVVDDSSTTNWSITGMQTASPEALVQANESEHVEGKEADMSELQANASEDQEILGHIKEECESIDESQPHMTVRINRATKLPNGKGAMGFWTDVPDAYVKLDVAFEGSGRRYRAQTKAIHDNKKPVWDFECSFPVPDEGEKKLDAKLTIFVHDENGRFFGVKRKDGFFGTAIQRVPHGEDGIYDMQLREGIVDKREKEAFVEVGVNWKALPVSAPLPDEGSSFWTYVFFFVGLLLLALAGGAAYIFLSGSGGQPPARKEEAPKQPPPQMQPPPSQPTQHAEFGLPSPAAMSGQVWVSNTAPPPAPNRATHSQGYPNQGHAAAW